MKQNNSMELSGYLFNDMCHQNGQQCNKQKTPKLFRPVFRLLTVFVNRNTLTTEDIWKQKYAHRGIIEMRLTNSSSDSVGDQYLYPPSGSSKKLSLLVFCYVLGICQLIICLFRLMNGSNWLITTLELLLILFSANSWHFG